MCVCVCVEHKKVCVGGYNRQGKQERKRGRGIRRRGLPLKVLALVVGVMTLNTNTMLKNNRVVVPLSLIHAHSHHRSV